MDINDAQHPARQKAIIVLERLAEKLGREDMFDNGWFDYEDLVTNIIAGDKP
jgi:hypothetical protein